MFMGRATCPLLWAAALGAAQPCGVSLTTRGIAPASLRYDRLTLVAWVAGPLCLAGDPLLDCVPAHLSTVASMAPGDVCHGSRCSLAGLGPAASGYRPFCWPGGSAGSPQCARPMGCWFFPVPRPPYVCTCVRCPGPLCSCSPVCPLGALLCLCGVLGHLAPVHRCARSVCCFACAISWATWLLFMGVPARSVALLVWCPGPLGSCSLVCPLRALLCVTGVLGHLAPVHRCARSVRCLCVRCPGPLGSCSPVCPLGVLFCFCGVLGHLAHVHRCARSVRCLYVRCPRPPGSCSPVCLVRCFTFAVSWATRLLFTGVPARCAVLRVRCPGPLGSCSPVCPLCVPCGVCGVLGHLASVHPRARLVRCFACAVSWATWLLFIDVPARCFACVCGVLGHLAPVHRCARSVRCFACAVSWATGLLFTGVPARCVACVCGVLGHLAPVHLCARSVCCFACVVSWATWLMFTGVPARSVALRVRCPGPRGSCSPVCPLSVLFFLCNLLGHLAPVHGCARSGRCFACVVSWATWLLFTGVPAPCVALRDRCPGPLGSCSPVCPLGSLPVCAVSWATWLLFTGVPAWCVVLLLRCPGPLGSCSPMCLLSALPVCAVSWATWLLFTGVPAWCVVLLLRCPGRLGSCSPVCLLGVLCCACGVLGHLAHVHRCARCVCRVACAVSWATWLLFTPVPARCVALRVRCPGPLGSCSSMCPLGVLPVCAVSWATWLLFTGVPARCVALHVRCPGPLGSCSPVCLLGVLPVCAVSWATWLLFTCVPAQCVVLLVSCPGPLGSCSPVCPLGPLLCVCGVLGHVAPVHRCARSVCCFSCAISCATWLLFTGVPARGVACLCGVLGHLAPVHRCARSVCSVACAVSWASWLLFTGVPAQCVVLRVRCPGPLGSCSPVCPLGVLCCVCGVLGPLALVHRCARPVCCAVSWATWLLFSGVRTRCVVLWVACAGLRGGALTRPRTVAIRSRQGLGTLQARTCPSGRRLFVAGRGWVPSGRTHVHPDGGCSVAGRDWVPCGARTRPSGGQLVLLGTYPRAVVRSVLCALSWFAAPGGRRCLAPVRVPWLWPAACLSGVPRGPAFVRRASSGPVALGAPVCFSDAVVPFPNPGACAPGFTGWLRGARGGQPRIALIVPAAGPRRGRGAGLAPRRTRSGPRDGVVPGGYLRRRSWAACAAVVGVCGPGH